MRRTRVIARLDVKNEFVIKGIHLEGLRKIGNPNELAKQYYSGGVDEIIFMDAVAAYYDRNSLGDIISEACRDIFVPITVGGGIRSVSDISDALNAGADKVAINTQAVRTPQFISEASQIFGSQCIVASIDAKFLSGKWLAYTDNGREPTGLDVVEWAAELERLGAGEIMLTSIDADGTKKGFDLRVTEAVTSAVNIPVIASGGCGSVAHVVELAKKTHCDAIAIASAFHYGYSTIHEVKSELLSEKIEVRPT